METLKFRERKILIKKIFFDLVVTAQRWWRAPSAAARLKSVMMQ
jgi:hypothetical protein